MDPRLISLHKHWCQADAIKQFINTDFKDVGKSGLPHWFEELGNYHSKMSRMCVWYALLFVVVEGFQELNLSHSDVDACLSNEEKVNYLRRFRNAVFHYQKDPLSEKILQFLEAEESEIWIRELNRALENFFFDVLPIEEQIKEIKKMA